jgi:hypothetical protein
MLIDRAALRCLLARHDVTFQRPETSKESTDVDFDGRAGPDRIST